MSAATAGPPILIIPGLDGAGRLFQPLIQKLREASHSVVLAEHLDEKEWLERKQCPRDLAFRVAETLKAEGHELALVCAESFGSMAALEFARRYPERTAGLVLCGGFGHLPFAGKRRLLKFTGPCLALSAYAVPTSLLRLARLIYHPLLRRGDPPHLRRLSRKMHVPSARCLLAKIELCLDFDAREWLNEIRCRAIIVAAEGDPVVPASCSRELAALIPHSRLVLLPEGGHLAHHADPDLMCRLLVNFGQESCKGQENLILPPS